MTSAADRRAYVRCTAERAAPLRCAASWLASVLVCGALWLAGRQVLPPPPVVHPGALPGWWRTAGPVTGTFAALRESLILAAGLWAAAATVAALVRLLAVAGRTGPECCRWLGRIGRGLERRVEAMGRVPLLRLALGLSTPGVILSGSGGTTAAWANVSPVPAGTLAGTATSATSAGTTPSSPAGGGPGAGSGPATGLPAPPAPVLIAPVRGGGTPLPVLTDPGPEAGEGPPAPSRQAPPPQAGHPNLQAGPRRRVTTTTDPAVTQEGGQAPGRSLGPSATNQTATPGPAPVPTTAPPHRTTPQSRSTPAPAPPHGGTWAIRPGDDFWSIAEAVVAGAGASGGAHSGAGMSDAVPPPPRAVAAYWSRLVAANRDRLPVPGDPNLLFAGDVIVLPPL